MVLDGGYDGGEEGAGSYNGSGADRRRGARLAPKTRFVPPVKKEPRAAPPHPSRRSLMTLRAITLGETPRSALP